MRRPPAWLALALLAGLATAHGLLWRNTAEQLAQAATTQTARLRADGWVVQHGPIETAGWPLTVRLTLPAFSLTHPGGPALRLEWLTVAANPLLPRRLSAEASGRMALQLPGLPELPFTADALTLTALAEPGGLPGEFALRAESPRAGALAGGVTANLLTVKARLHPPAQQGEPLLAVTARAEAITWPAPLPPLGPVIRSLEIDATLTGPWPRSASPATRAAAWRDAGGVVQLQRASLSWGPLEFTAGATLSLDDALQPMGAGLLQGRGLDHLATLATRFADSESLATLHADLARSRPPTDLVWTLRSRTLAAGRLPLARIPALPWPEPAAAATKNR